MDVRSLAPLLVCLSVALSGCVGDDETAAPSEPRGPGDDAATGNDAAEGRPGLVVAAPLSATSAFTVTGETPASIGVCGLPDPSDPCVSHLIDGGDYVLDIPHTGNVTSITFSLTFEPITPAVTELYHMLHVDDGVTNTMMSGGVLASGDQVTLDELDVNATAIIIFFAWPVGHETPLGAAWVDPVVQRFTVEGTVRERVASA